MPLTAAWVVRILSWRHKQRAVIGSQRGEENNHDTGQWQHPVSPTSAGAAVVADAESGEEGIQAAADLLGGHQGLQPALYPLPRHGDGVDVAQRSAHKESAGHYLPDCRLWEPHPCAQRRRTAVPG